MVSPYNPNTSADRLEILRAIGVSSVQELFSDIPSEYRDSRLELPSSLSEMELLSDLEGLAAQNRHTLQGPSFLGAGSYNHYVPSVVQAIASRGEFLTAYTPYQPEVSQGTLQVAYEFQTLICQLFNMDVANTGLYDGATSLAEAALMACRITKRYRVAYIDTLSPAYRDVLETYTIPQGIEVYSVPNSTEVLSSDTACLIVQNPNFLGYMEDLNLLRDITHKAGSLLIVSTDPIAMGMFRPPGDYGADIVVAEGQPLGVPVGFGGPYIGLFTCKSEYLRQMPGRIVGRTVDHDGRTGYVLTLQTREQHIRRERATSNVCTSQALISLMVTVYLALVGKRGIRRLSEICYHRAHYAASLLGEIPGYRTFSDGTFFKEFVLECPLPVRDINLQLLDSGITGGLDISHLVPNGMLLCFTEQNTRQDIEILVNTLAEIR